ncbi:unnamed protein product [Adineta steineri]|uniref:Secreted protein n=1 Tax=Adineta steineri TaxID=433720 RepID=A0A815B949_9BILA|nr:unnamed protein product [Adineta steineri]CAF1270447.1 unnamed protein product [Adineta steineri]CAF3623118.1 unnamed protein product [Adineta steineri]CAF3875669.1 unnamed protein product [Adineta steineri]
MRLILLQLLLLIWIHNHIFCFGLQRITSTIATTTTLKSKSTKTDGIDLQDGHPNHRLWQKMIDTERASSGDWYV